MPTIALLSKDQKPSMPCTPRPSSRGVLTIHMTHRGVAVAATLKPDVAVMLISMDRAATAHVVPDLAKEREALRVRHVLNAHLAAALQHTEQDRLVLAAQLLARRLPACDQFFSLPPNRLSSASISPVSGRLNELVRAASRSRWSMNHAVFCVTWISRASCALAMPFLCDVISQIAANHFRSGILVSWKIVPTLIEKRCRQSPHLWVRLSRNGRCACRYSRGRTRRHSNGWP